MCHASCTAVRKQSLLCQCHEDVSAVSGLCFVLLTPAVLHQRFCTCWHLLREGQQAAYSTDADRMFSCCCFIAGEEPGAWVMDLGMAVPVAVHWVPTGAFCVVETG